MKAFVEGYGCALNIGETEQISGFLKKNAFFLTEKLKEADVIIINTCSVKMVTEQRMISRIQYIFENKKKQARVFVNGCLAKTNKEQLEKIFPDAKILDTKLESLSKALELEAEGFSPKIIEEKSHDLISIIPISVGCIGDCAYCATKLARGELKSYSIEEINVSFKRALKNGSKEVWITSQDLGCYGFDIGKNLSELVSVLLKNEGEYRIRLGMMNPRHFKKIRNDLMPLFKDERLYNFLHLPVQSGSDKILKAMNRMSTKKDFVDAVEYARKSVPDIRISTDIIVGFPGEKEQDFNKSLELLEKTKPSVLNISRFGKRKGTKAAKMPGQLEEKEKKKRSRILSEKSRELFLKENKKMLGFKGKALVSEKANKNGFVARTNNYAPVLVNEYFGEFVELEINEVFAHFFKGKSLG